MFIPSMILKQLYTFGSLENVPDGIRFSLKNRLSDAQVTELMSVKIDGQTIPAGAVHLALDEETVLAPGDISADRPVDFPLRQTMDILADTDPLPAGKHKIEINFRTAPFGKLKLEVEDAISRERQKLVRIPRRRDDDYGAAAIGERQTFLREFTNTDPEHIFNYSFDPHLLTGNVEHFTAVAQVPIGLAGPLQINGEQAQGEYLIPMATTEGTLVASYNRGMKVINLCGGVTCTVVGDVMQRAPVFVFENARQAREFNKWVGENIDKIREEAEATSSVRVHGLHHALRAFRNIHVYDNILSVSPCDTGCPQVMRL